MLKTAGMKENEIPEGFPDAISISSCVPILEGG